MLSKLEKSCSNRYFKNLEELPVYNWWKVHDTKDLEWITRGNKRPKRFAKKRLKKLDNEFIDTFGVNKKYENYLDKLCKLEEIKIDIVLSGDKSKQIFADILELEIGDILKESEGKSHNHGVMGVEKYIGFKLNTRKISTYEFYSYVKEIEKQLIHSKRNV